jgi:tRNA A37 threonylcarbamoyladenosine modification protein TsaB
MLVLVDNSGDGEIVFFLHEKNIWRREAKRTANKKSLLENFEQVLAKHKKSVQDITGIAVVIGLGRFTATRIAVTVANALGFALKIPVVAITSADPALAQKKLAKAKPGLYISAKYSAEAHISGVQKKIL